MNNGRDRIFAFSDYNTFNRNFKRLGKNIAGIFDKEFTYAQSTGMDVKHITKKRHQMLHSHCLRSAALSELAKKSLVLARQYSGHSDFRTLKKHYLKDDYSEEEILEMLKTED